ncbi:TonB-dependent receptor [Apibacter muscae]|uniref:TonB-dependent receptor plug domain-containing protein n=1 Tax=Apibacter muscae TaxID=2509004 RepID=UPI0011AC7684|nr:TonB-dependent receptor plug domain-containing protein [Apibacter muscae]TWP31033.1 TonB-dependent receptor [Apibacter muscae]
MRIKTLLTFFLSMLFFTLYYSQITDSLYIDSTNMETVVVTGQYSQQSIDKSIYQVEVISQEEIKNRAANTIADILNYHLNFSTSSNSKTGDSEATLFGLDNQYFKVLVDNIPLVSDHGMGGSVDLTKINLDNVERIEIVKGSMGVDYGSNSFTGVINIITKKKVLSDWKISGYVQEESVGTEYNLKNKGRHIQAIDLAHNISDHWMFSMNMYRNDFKGYFGDMKGKKYYENDNKRGYEWLPKDQWNTSALINYKSNNFSAFYKLEYLNELINYYSPTTRYAPLQENGLYTYSATEKDFKTTRFINHLFVNARIFNQINFKGDLSYQKQNRESRDYIYNIGNREIFEKKGNYQSYSKTKAWYIRGTFNDFITNSIFNFQVGYEFNIMEGYRAANSTSVQGINISGYNEDVKKHLNNYDAFTSGELKVSQNLSLRGGFRASFNTKFENLYSYSFLAKYNLSKNSTIRGEIATSSRTPNFDELYTYYVNTNHNIQGNPNLTPEKGYSTAIYWDTKINTNSGLRAKFEVSSMYLHLNDKIALATVSSLPLEYKYMNIDKYQSWGIQSGNNLRYENFDFHLGLSLFGVYQKMDNNINGTIISTPDNKYLYTFQLNSNISYSIKKWDTTLSLYYKYTGQQSQYFLDANTNSYYLGKQEDYHLLDASVRKYILKRNVELTVGARNLFNVKTINTNSINSNASNAHGNSNISSINLFYGRSYFVKLGFNLNL